MPAHRLGDDQDPLAAVGGRLVALGRRLRAGRRAAAAGGGAGASVGASAAWAAPVASASAPATSHDRWTTPSLCPRAGHRHAHPDTSSIEKCSIVELRRSGAANLLQVARPIQPRKSSDHCGLPGRLGRPAPALPLRDELVGDERHGPAVRRPVGHVLRALPAEEPAHRRDLAGGERHPPQPHVLVGGCPETLLS